MKLEKQQTAESSLGTPQTNSTHKKAYNTKQQHIIRHSSKNMKEIHRFEKVKFQTLKHIMNGNKEKG